MANFLNLVNNIFWSSGSCQLHKEIGHIFAIHLTQHKWLQYLSIEIALKYRLRLY